jgi:SpoVK/Ycf46/Vps4 family AAA+-type ATPase
LAGGGDSGEEARAAALVERFAEAREMPHSLLVLDDIDQLCAGRGPGGYSSVLLATLRALLRSPPSSSSMAKAGGQSESKVSSQGTGKTVHIIASTSRSDAACVTLHELFDETIGKKDFYIADCLL